MEDYDFEQGDAGSSGMEKVSAGGLHKGNLVMIKDCPCKVTIVGHAKPGKHGAAKAIVTGIDIFTNNKLETTFSTGDMVDAPLVKRVEYTVVNIEDDGFLQLLDDSGEMKEDIQFPTEEHLKEVVDKTKEIFEAGKNECLVIVLQALGREQLVSVREGKEI